MFTDNLAHCSLIYASFGGYLEVAELLIKAGADLNAQTSFGQTALMKAAFANSHHIMSALIKKGANVDLQAKNGSTALMIAAMTNNLKIVEYLHDFGHANVDIQYVRAWRLGYIESPVFRLCWLRNGLI